MPISNSTPPPLTDPSTWANMPNGSVMGPPQQQQQAQQPSFPGSWANIANGQMGGQSEMQAHGLSADAGPTSGLSGNTNATPGNGRSIQSMLQSALNSDPSLLWRMFSGGGFNPGSLVQMWQQQMQQPQQAQQLTSRIPQSFFSQQNIAPWQQPPMQA